MVRFLHIFPTSPHFHNNFGVEFWGEKPDFAMSADLRSRRLRQVAGIALLPVIFILPIVVVLLVRISAVHQSETVEERSDTVISQTHVVREELFGMEAALRGYLLTGDAAFRRSFADQGRRVEAALSAIQEDSTGNPAMTARVAGLLPHVRDWLAYASAAMAATYGSSNASQISIGDERRMGAIENDIAAILTAKTTERGEIISRAEGGIRTMILLVIGCALLTALATGLSVRRVLIVTDVERRAEQERVRLDEARRRTADLERENVRIRTADKFKSEYLATMSHELRTPLTAMLGFSEVIRDGKVGTITAEQAECVDHIIKSGRHLLELVGTVLDLAKVEAGKLDVAMVVTDPRLPVRDVVDGMRELAARKGIRLDVDLARAPQHVLIDPPRLRQILYNYLSNAIKFTPRGGAITVRVLPDGDGFRLEVNDTGVGIDTAELGNLFKEFRQVDLQSNTEPGTGLGLALTKRLTEALGGYVGVMSERGIGSSFYAIFPDSVAAARRAQPRLEAVVA
jgi:signal transduction histidine kinase